MDHFHPYWQLSLIQLKASRNVLCFSRLNSYCIMVKRLLENIMESILGKMIKKERFLFFPSMFLVHPSWFSFSKLTRYIFDCRLWSVIKIFDEHKKLYRNAHSQLSQIFESSYWKVFQTISGPENYSCSSGVIAGTCICSADNIPVVKYCLAQDRVRPGQIWILYRERKMFLVFSSFINCNLL